MALLFFLLSLLTPQTPTPVQAADEKDQAQSAAFTVGALRRDGIVSPFAVFDGKHWSVPWPADLPTRERSLSPGRIPYEWWGKTGPLTEMAAWIGGVNRGIVHLTHPVPLRVMCEWRIGLASDYHAEEPAVPPFVQPYPKDGLAVSGTQRVDAIEILSATSPEWSQTAGFIKEEFDRAEQAAARLYTQWKNPIPPSVRQSTPVQIEAMYRAPMDREGWVAYYVEGIKSYPPGPEDDRLRPRRLSRRVDDRRAGRQTIGQTPWGPYLLRSAGCDVHAAAWADQDRRQIVLGVSDVWQRSRRVYGRSAHDEWG